MSLASTNAILASDFVSLKTRVKAEMNRRKYVGSLTAYAGTTYDYAVTPVSGGIVSAEHINKLVIPVNAIAASGYTAKNSGEAIPELSTFDTKLKAHESQALYGATDCASSCSGLCRTACSDTCSGCTGCSGCGGCDTTCSGTCSGGCDGGCSGCGSGCNAGCAPTCAGGCWTDGCTSNCTAACRMDCETGCSTSCGTACRRVCGGTCYATCATTVGYT